MNFNFKSAFIFTLTLFVPVSSYAEDVVIGAVLPLSGPLVSIGEGVRKGIEIAKDKVNTRWKGAGRNLVIKYQDSSGEPAKAITAFSYLKSVINYPVIYSSLTSSAQALKPLAEKESILLIVESNATNILDNTEMAIRNFITADSVGKAAAEKFKEFNYKNISIIQAEEEWSEGVVDEIRKEENKGLLRIGALEKVSKGETDIRSILLRLKSKNPNPDITFIILLGAVESNTIIQAKQLGFKSLAATYLCGQPQIMNGLKGNFEGQMNIGFNIDSSSESYKKFFSEYQKRYASNYPEAQGMAAHDDILLIAEAIENKKVSAKEVKEFLIAREPFQGAFGLTKFNEKGDSRHSAKAQKVIGEECLDY